MCGIGGYFALSSVPDASTRLQDTAAALAHRGPDGAGIWTSDDQNVGLSHTRLSIVDLSARGNQPMTLAQGLPVIVFNGEIYNWRDLRERLIAFGHTFVSNSDTEVLLRAYLQWGTDVLQMLRGMFAFAIWDPRERIIFCARDHLGEKPFVYAETNKGFVFGSEIPPVLSMLDIIGASDALDHSAISAMLLHNIRHIPDPATAYKAIRKLRAGHAMIIKNACVARMWRYWNPVTNNGMINTKVDCAVVRRFLEEAIEMRRISDVPVGGLLSGGVDSSAIISLAQSASAEPIKTYALGLDRNDEDLRRARLMSEKIGTEHKEFYFESEAQWSGFQSIIAIHGEPIMLLPLVHTYELCKAVRADGIKVVLSGNGADELFYGYTGMVQTGHLSSAVSMLEALSPLLRLLPDTTILPRSLQVLRAARGERKAELYRGYAQRTWARVLTKHAIQEIVNIASSELKYWGELGPNMHYIDESSFCGLMLENTHSITTAGDLPAMMAGVEMRAPFLDQKMVALALQTSWREKLPPGSDPSRLKYILKKAVRDLLPREIIYAPKRGFGMGITPSGILRGSWRRYGVELFNEPHDADGLFNVLALRNLWNNFLAGDNRDTDIVLKLFAIQHWLHSRRNAA